MTRRDALKFMGAFVACMAPTKVIAEMEKFTVLNEPGVASFADFQPKPLMQN